MNPIDINVKQLLTTFFTAHHCTILENEDKNINVQLTKEMDLALMNRPFYWQYIESTGNLGQPMRLNFALDKAQTDKITDWIYFGSSRFNQIITHLRRNAQFVRMYEQGNASEREMLQPWLVLNVVITYVGKQSKESLLSIGLNLINGDMKSNMMESLHTKQLAATIADNCYTISPLIRLESAYKRIEKVLYHHVEQMDHTWAMESLQLLEEEIEMIEHFFTSEDEEMKEQEINTVNKRLQPTISFSVLNGGMFYLQNKNASST